MNTKPGGSAKGRNADSANWKKDGWVSTSVTGAVVSPTAGEVVLRANGHIKQVCNAVKRNLYYLICSSLGRYDEYDRWNRDEDDVPQGLGAEPAPVDTDMTGDEAYQRRLAMSSGPQQPTPAVAAVDRNMSGDDAYTRRMAMSSSQPLSFPREETGDDVYQHRAAVSSLSIVHQPEPLSELSPSLAYNPFAPTSVPPPPPGPPPSVEDEVARKREAAAAIAAKLAALAAIQPPEGSTLAPQTPAQQYV